MRNCPVPELGKLLVIVGFVIVIFGVLLWTGIGTGWLGRLPGDIRYQRDQVQVYVPIVSMLLLSLGLSLLFYLLRRFF